MPDHEQQQLQLHVDAAMHGARIDRLLAERFPQITRSRFQKLLRDGCVTAGGRKVRSAYRVVSGEDIMVRVPAPEPLDLEPENIPLSIVFEDEALIVVDKPAGMVTHPAVGSRSGTLVHALLFHRPTLAGGAAFRPGIVHRLDKDTSGLLVVAKTEHVHARLSVAMQKRLVRREYLAVVWGRMPQDHGVIAAPIGRHPVERQRMAVVPAGKAARTHFQVVERLASTSVLRLQLDSGRTHQIRVHLAWRGHPVFGDATYGGRNSRLTHLSAGLRVGAREALQRLSRQALHASRLSLQHPVSGQDLVFESQPPEDIRDTLAMLRRPAPGARA